MLQFDAAIARLLENAYRGSDVVRRRLATLEALAPQAGDVIVDVGSGPGYLSLELARAVGETGEVIAVDPSAEMRTAAAAQCTGVANVRIVDGTATGLPLGDGSADRAASLQVLEYLNDIPRALSEIRRVLRPGGRLVIGDWHWDSWIWHSTEPERMGKMMSAWDRHLADRGVPARLPHMMHQAGFHVEGIRPLVFLDTVLRNDGVALMLLNLMQAYALQHQLVEESTVRAWAEEQRDLASQGAFFFSLVHFVIFGRRT